MTYTRGHHKSIKLPDSLADVAWKHIREDILSGVLRPGETITIKEQAARLGISIMPVREAIKRLQHEGLVWQEPRKEPIVAPLSISDMEDIYRVRIALEGLAVELACESIDESGYRELCDVLDRFESAYEMGDVRLGREMHRCFHLGFVKLSNSTVLHRLVPSLIDASERYRELSVRGRGPVRQRRLEHQRILDACYAKDKNLAKNLLMNHLLTTVEIVREEVLRVIT
ncbi:MAG: GntR family transcriptional regulator [Alicyclobacillus sp.]|nr:GntR family transcriptional regulator [Alicyclobacillus sp.]